jgi:K+/H+ antiporter YhaU regulatory subunit KhtT
VAGRPSEAGDTLVVLGHPDSLKRLEAEAAS